jgi:hypothetical protein
MFEIDSSVQNIRLRRTHITWNMCTLPYGTHIFSFVVRRNSCVFGNLLKISIILKVIIIQKYEVLRSFLCRRVLSCNCLQLQAVRMTSEGSVFCTETDN